MCAAVAANLRNKAKQGGNRIAPLEPKYGHGASFLQSKFDAWNTVLLGVNNRLVETHNNTENEILEGEDNRNITHRVKYFVKLKA